MNRVLVVGSTGSGKTTVARKLARELGAPFVEMDALFWLAGWTEVPTEVFLRRVDDATKGERWVTDGNYGTRLGTFLWERADTVVWLDISLWRIVPRLVKRTTVRAVRRTDLWGTGNRESIANIWNKGSLIRWAFKVREEHRQRYEAAMADPRFGDVRVVRLHSPRDVRRFLADLP